MAKNDDAKMEERTRKRESMLRTIHALVGMTPMGMSAKDIAYVLCICGPDGLARVISYDGSMGILPWENEAAEALLGEIPEEETGEDPEPVKLKFKSHGEAFERFVDAIERAGRSEGTSFAGVIRIVMGGDGRSGRGFLSVVHEGGHQPFRAVRSWLELRSMVASGAELN